MSTPKTYIISSQILIYAILATFLVSLMMMMTMGLMYWFALQQVDDLRTSLHISRQSADACRIGLERADAKLDAVDRLFAISRDKPNDAKSLGSEH